MPSQLLTLIQQRPIARDTVELVFAKPPGLQFRAGQYGGFTLINPAETDERGITRRFSLLSHPDHEHVIIATRLQSSAYKRMLGKLKPGDTIRFAGPVGNFVLHEDPQVPAVFIAGGIGITPFYSMLQHAIAQASAQPLSLFYGNQTESDACYLDELRELQDRHPALTYVPVLARPSHGWQGETGFITEAILRKHIADLTQPIFYLCGSPAMVAALRATLLAMAISDTQIRAEDFPGY